MTALALLILLLAYTRLAGVRPDRDYTPYAYPAVFGTGYLQGGHIDIKPPLIHWSYKLWWKITSLTPLSLMGSHRLRLLPFLGLSLASVCVATLSPAAGLTLALLCASPSLWVHMANTEWLTVLLWSLALACSQIHGANEWAWVLLGLTPWANQKNVLLIAPVAWAMALKFTHTSLGALAFPSVVILMYLGATGRLGLLWRWAWVVPKSFGSARTVKANILGHVPVLVPGLCLLAPVIATAQGPWAWVALAVAAVALSSKQVVPHHYIALAFPLALAAQPSVALFVAFALVYATRDLWAMVKPRHVYPLTFPGYETTFLDSVEVLEWIAGNTKPDEAIWVNGMENQLYLEANRKAWGIQVPELRSKPEGEAPRVIVHTRGHVEFDYANYKRVLTSPRGLFSIMVKR